MLKDVISDGVTGKQGRYYICILEYSGGKSVSDVCLTTVLSYRPRWIVRYQHIESVSSSGPVDDKKGMQFSEQNLRQ